MRICHVVPSIEERYGGPSRSVMALARSQAELGHEVTLLATDPTSGRETAEGTLHVRICRRDRPGLLCPSGELRRALQAVAPDILHHHGLWLRTLHYSQQLAVQRHVPLVVSPRGMMSPWAWNHRRWRKALARAFVHPGALERAAGWHATSDDEAADVRRLGFKQPVCVAPNGVVAPSETDRATAAAYWRQLCPALQPERTALFYSRFHQKKRVLELIDLWLQHAPADWSLLMVGLPEDYTAAQIETYVLRSSGPGRVRVYDGEHHPAPYAVASLFLLPSHSENFGLVIAEAMSHGLPVVVTDTTPWLAVNPRGAGWCVPWERYPAVLAEALAEPAAQRAARGAVARSFVLADYSWKQAAAKMLGFYRQLLGLHG
jgi:glycosyltransferase involved in cell wall biosynthesis